MYVSIHHRDLATQVQLFPGPFGNSIGDYTTGTMRCKKTPCDHGPCTETVPCGPSKVQLRHFIYYVAGAHHLANFTVPKFLLDDDPGPGSDADA